MPPAVIGRYRIVRTLGVGGMGEVYQGWDEELQRPVAIKGLLSGTPSPEQQARLRREARAVAALSHPNVAHVYEIVQDGGREWIVMEFIDGQPLSKIVKGGPLALSEVARIGAAVADALEAAHQHGLIHRDVKTENVMITTDGHVKVLDFGLAKWTEPREAQANLTAEGLVVGTTRAMSPEQALGQAIDARSDIFSLGSLLYELASGRPAFDGGTPAEIMHRVAGCRAVPVWQVNPRLPLALVRVIERCMARRPADRYQTAAEVASALRSPELAGGTAVATRALAATALYWRTREHWPAAAGAVLALAALVASAVYFGWLSSPAPRVVAVLPATTDTSAEGAALAATAVTHAIAEHLARLEGIVTISGREVRAIATEDRRPTDIARELGANELVEASLTPGEGGRLWRVTLSRVEGTSGKMLWSRTVETAADDLFVLQDRVTTTLEDGYRGFSTARSAPPREASPAALRAFLEATTRLEGGRSSPGYREEISLLRAAIATSPRYLDPVVNLAAIHRYLYATTHDAAHRDEMDRLLARALELAPEDPQVQLVQVAALVAKGESEAAAERARELTRQRPGDPSAWAELGKTLAALGRYDEAERALRRAYALRPAWQTLYFLADVRRARGDYPAARETLAPILAAAPANTSALAKLAEVEMYAGDFARSEALYREVVAQRETKSDLVNLGNAVFFQGRYQEAAELYQRATTLATSDPLPIANLADALLVQGRQQEAAQAYRRALALCTEQLDAGRRTRTLLDLRARCLAHLGLGEQAVLAVQEAIREFPDNPETVFVAALVAAINGDDTSCLAWTRRAIQLHAPRGWFATPDFHRLQANPAFRELLDSAR
jgi:tetratricopeptide (TPR) repeat protein/TolB-like protein/predicted Ser/Thr protein kinase